MATEKKKTILNNYTNKNKYQKVDLLEFKLCEQLFDFKTCF